MSPRNKVTKRGWVRFLICLATMFVLEQAVSAVSMNVAKASRVSLIPGVDLVRQNIANIVINANQAYTVALNDDTGGVLSMGYHKIPYRVSYNNSSDIELSHNPVTMESAASAVNGNRTIAITVLGTDTARAAAGDYRSTLTVTITAF